MNRTDRKTVEAVLDTIQYLEEKGGLEIFETHEELKKLIKKVLFEDKKTRTMLVREAALVSLIEIQNVVEDEFLEECCKGFVEDYPQRRNSKIDKFSKK